MLGEAGCTYCFVCSIANTRSESTHCHRGITVLPHGAYKRIQGSYVDWNYRVTATVAFVLAE